jgi:hypothetical protein
LNPRDQRVELIGFPKQNARRGRAHALDTPGKVTASDRQGRPIGGA